MDGYAALGNINRRANFDSGVRWKGALKFSSGDV